MKPEEVKGYIDQQIEELRVALAGLKGRETEAAATPRSPAPQREQSFEIGSDELAKLVAGTLGVNLKTILADVESERRNVSSRSDEVWRLMLTASALQSQGIIEDGRNAARNAWNLANTAAGNLMAQSVNAAGITMHQAASGYGRQVDLLINNDPREAAAESLMIQFAQLNADAQKGIGAITTSLVSQSAEVQKTIGAALAALASDLAKKSTATPAGGVSATAKSGDTEARVG